MSLRAINMRPATIAARAAHRLQPMMRAPRPGPRVTAIHGSSAALYQPSSLLLRSAVAAYSTDTKGGQQAAGQAPPQAPPPPQQKGQTQGRKGFKNSTIFTVLIGAGLLMTIYGVLEWWYALQIWPESVRDPLKKALKARNKGDYESSNAYFNEAIQACFNLYPGDLDPEPLLKVSGIYITQATMLEEAGYPLRAYIQLYKALTLFGPRPLAAVPPPTGGWAGHHALSPAEIHRGIGLAQKLGSLAAAFGAMKNPPAYPVQAIKAVKEAAEPTQAGPDEADQVDVTRVPSDWNAAAEYFLSNALAAMLRIGLGQKADFDGDRPDANIDSSGFAAKTPVVAGRDIVLPQDGDDDMEYGGKVNRRSMGITMETLAEVYARDERYDLAGQLLLQTLSILLPPDEKHHSSGDLCRAAQVMTNISAYATEPPAKSPEDKAKQYKVSETWSKQSLQVIDEVKKEEGWGDGAPKDNTQLICDRAKSVAQYNLGMIAEMRGDTETASTYFADAAETARLISFNEGYRSAKRAHKRVKNLLLPPPSISQDAPVLGPADAEIMSG